MKSTQNRIYYLFGYLTFVLILALPTILRKSSFTLAYKKLYSTTAIEEDIFTVSVCFSSMTPSLIHKDI